MSFRYDAKIRAARAILNISRSDLAESCGISATIIQRIEGGYGSVSSANNNLLEDFFKRNGIIFHENSIEFSSEKEKIQKNKKLKKLTNEEIYNSLKINQDFTSCFSNWDEDTKNNIFSVVRSFNKIGLDIWYVDMGGEIRIGFKDTNEEKGKPFSFIKFKKEGFTIDFNRRVSKYSEYIKRFPISFGHGTLVDKCFVDNLEKLSSNGVELPPVIQSSSEGRLPTDYPRL